MSDLKEIIKKRRSYYSINDQSPISDSEIKELLDLAVLNVPSAFNSQSTRVVLLLGKHHIRLWHIVKEHLRKATDDEGFARSKAKIEGCFECGHGTVLFFEDTNVVKGLQNSFPLYDDNFPVWSQHTSAMHQYAVWMLLEDAGLGASLQHYNPLIDSDVTKEWGFDPAWKLIAQMPFGTPTGEPGDKEFQPLEKRSLVFD